MNNNILFISRAYGKDAGGMERLSYELIKEFQSDKSLTVTILVNQNTRRVAALLFILTSIPKALSLAKQADVIHIGDPVLSFLGYLIKTIYQKPVFVTVHGLDVSYHNPIYQLYLTFFFRKFTGYIAISEGAKIALKRLEPLGRIQTIPPGIHDIYYDQNISRSQLSKFLQQKNISTNQNAIYLLTVGRLVDRKGHAWFIKEVLPHLPKSYHYLIAGAGPNEARLKHIIQTEHLDSQVHLLGQVSHHDLTILYNTTDAFIQPNIPHAGDLEGFGLVLAEAATCQRLVLASDLEGIKDAISHNQNGILLPPSSASAWIEAIKTHVQSGTQNPSARPHTLQKFNWPRIKQAYQAFFNASAQ